MREIIFRGKRVENGEWIYGSPMLQDGYAFIRFWSSEEFMCVERTVIPETVGQYTGLRDCKRTEEYPEGQKIFEGDIIHGAAHWLERYVPAVVTFRNGSFGLLWYRGEVEEFNPFTSMCNVEYTVVGNIYDNPELMKGGEEECI